MKTHSKVLLAVVFVLGCFASQVVREVVVPRPVQAQTADGGAAPAGAKWQYGCTEIGWHHDDPAEIADVMDRWGALGWEVATDYTHGEDAVYCFKQRI